MAIQLRSRSAAICILGNLFGISAGAAYPDRPVHFFVGYAPGGAIDIVTRLVAAKLSERWGQPIVIENKPGADGAIATGIVAHSPGDGYAVSWVSAGFTITPYQGALDYDPVKSLSAVTEVAYDAVAPILLINSSVPVNSLRELVEYSKTHPGQLTAGAASGPLGTSYLNMKLLLTQLGVKAEIAPYTGGGRVITALLGNEVQLCFVAPTVAAEQIKAGKVRALATSSDARSPDMPDVPTVAEAGNLPGYNVVGWYGVLVPASTPGEIVTKLRDDIASTIHQPDLQATLRNNGYAPLGSGPQDFQKKVVSEIDRWGSILKSLNPK